MFYCKLDDIKNKNADVHLGKTNPKAVKQWKRLFKIVLKGQKIELWKKIHQ